MPVAYEIDPVRKLIRTTCTGQVLLCDVLEHFDILSKDPNRPDHPDVLLNLTELESPPRTPQLRVVADRISWDPGFNFGRLAIVAVQDVVFGIARMFEVYTRDYFQEAVVFRDTASAERWLAEQRAPAVPDPTKR